MGCEGYNTQQNNKTVDKWDVKAMTHGKMISHKPRFDFSKYHSISIQATYTLLLTPPPHPHKPPPTQKKKKVWFLPFPPSCMKPRKQGLTSLPEDVALFMVGVELLGKAMGLQQTVSVQQQLRGAQELVHALILLLCIVAWVHQMRFIHTALVMVKQSVSMKFTHTAHLMRNQRQSLFYEIHLHCPFDEKPRCSL